MTVSVAALQNLAMPMFLFFLPFAPLLKMAPKTTSFFTLALLMVYAICMVKGWRNMRIQHLVPALLLLGMTMVVKVVNGFAISDTYILFMISLFLVPFLATEMDGRYDFYWLTLFFACGIVVAALTSQLLADSYSIARYINVVLELGINRRTGYYNDPNFYSAHITAALGGVLVLLLNEKSRARSGLLIGMAMLLFYCGLQSISKTFLLTGVCLLICWSLAFLLRRGRLSSKIVMVMTLVLIVLFILSSSIFTDLLDLMFSRLQTTELTTGRLRLWGHYFRAFRDDIALLFFGNGYSDTLIVGRAAHNTLIQSVFLFGVLGVAIFVGWIVCLVKNMMTGHQPVRRLDWAQGTILVMGTLGPWMALDYLFFDEFFLMPLYLCVAIRFLTGVLPQDEVAEEASLY